MPEVLSETRYVLIFNDLTLGKPITKDRGHQKETLRNSTNILEFIFPNSGDFLVEMAQYITTVTRFCKHRLIVK